MIMTYMPWPTRYESRSLTGTRKQRSFWMPSMSSQVPLTCWRSCPHVQSALTRFQAPFSLWQPHLPILPQVLPHAFQDESALVLFWTMSHGFGKCKYGVWCGARCWFASRCEIGEGARSRPASTSGLGTSTTRAQTSRYYCLPWRILWLHCAVCISLWRSSSRRKIWTRRSAALWNSMRCLGLIFAGTIQHFVNHFEANDAEVFQIDLINLRDTFNKLIDPAHWRFLESQEGHRKRPTTMSEHEQRCAEIEAHIRQSGVAKCPRMVGRHRVLLHAYTGRRRVGDVQYFMEQFAALRPDYVIHVVSLDIIVDTQWGDASNPATREYWIEAIKAGYVLAFVGGPPCETWSRASPWWVTEAGPQDHPGCGTSLGVRRDHFTWSSSTHHG